MRVPKAKFSALGMYLRLLGIISSFLISIVDFFVQFLYPGIIMEQKGTELQVTSDSPKSNDYGYDGEPNQPPGYELTPDERDMRRLGKKQELKVFLSIWTVIVHIKAKVY
jgi:hypothetical protein